MERCATNIWGELNGMRFCGLSEWKYLRDNCTIIGATEKQVVLKSFEEQGLIGLYKFSTFTVTPFIFFIPKYHIFVKYLTKIFSLNLWTVFTCHKQLQMDKTKFKRTATFFRETFPYINWASAFHQISPLCLMTHRSFCALWNWLKVNLCDKN